MSEKMTVLFVKDTGNVVAALTRAADPEAAIAPDLLAGEQMVLRYVGRNPLAAGYGDTEFLIEPDQLDVLKPAPDLDNDVISRPRQFYVGADKKVVAANVVTTITPSFPNGTQIRITLSAAATLESKVWVEIVGRNPDEKQIVTGKIIAGDANVTINLRPLESSTAYDVLTFVQGYVLDRATVTSPP